MYLTSKQVTTISLYILSNSLFNILKQEVLGRTNRLLSFDTWTAQKTTPPTIPRFRGNVFTEPLPSNDKKRERERKVENRRVDVSEKLWEVRPTLLWGGERASFCKKVQHR
jgi:hypothetical protein